MGQYSYYLGTEEDREEGWKTCVQKMMKERVGFLRDSIWDTYGHEKEDIQESFYQAVTGGIDQVLGQMEKGQKKPIRYIHVSYLLSSALSGEMLVKLDFYDENYFSNICDTDCYWDYHLLFPEYAGALAGLEERLYAEVVRLTSHELQRARLYYQVCNFMALEEVIRKLVKTEHFQACIRPCSESVVSILYGAYLDQAELIYEVG